MSFERRTAPVGWDGALALALVAAGAWIALWPGTVPGSLI